MRFISGLLAAVCLYGSSASSGPPATVSIPTARFDLTRDGWNSQERQLTPASLSHFGKLGTYAVDGFVYAQPLIIPGVIVDSVQVDVMIVATMNNSVYAFDANSPGKQLWTINLGAPRSMYSTPFNFLYGAPVGIMATPVVSNGRIYVVTATPTPSYTLFELSLSHGATINSVTVTGQVPGTGDPMGGDCTSGSNIVFCPSFETQRTALTLANGNVYFGFGSYGDLRPWHGWIFAYDATTLAQTALFCITPSGYGGGVWQAGSGLAVDGSGDLYAFTGNGTYDGSTEWANSVLKFDANLNLLDWFTPANFATLEADDLDVSGGATMLMPGTPYVFGAGKDSRMIVLDTTNLGHLQGSGTAPVQIFSFGSNILYGGFFSGTQAVYQNTAPGSGGSFAPNSFSWSAPSFNTSPVVSGNTYGFPGSQISGSSNSGLNTILWMTSTASTSSGPSSPPQGTLYALDPVTLSVLYSSDTHGADSLGALSKFAPPVVANGRVYVPTQSNVIAVYGLK